MPWSAGAIIVIAILVAAIVPPFIYLIETSFYTTTADGSFDDFTLAYYEALFRQPQFAGYLLNTTLYALGTAAVAVLLGMVQAWIVERTDTPLREYAFLVAGFDGWASVPTPRRAPKISRLPL